MNKKGFTLMELLAVIVILAVIALIATPIILNVVDNSRRSAFKSSIQNSLNSARLIVTSEEIELPHRFNLSDENAASILNLTGDVRGWVGYILFDEDGRTVVSITNGKWCASKTADETEITLLPNDECEIPLSFVEISNSGEFTVALDTYGNVFTWGRNHYGQLGVGNRDVNTEINQILKGEKVISVFASLYHAFAINDKGQLYGWGYSSNGEVGSGITSTSIGTPTLITGITNVKKVCAGESHSVALTADGDVYVWGENTDGELLSSDLTLKQKSPLKVENTLKFNDIACGYNHVVVLANDSKLYGWGKNDVHQLGQGADETNRYEMTEIPSSVSFVSIASKYNHNLALTSDGKLYGWGYNNNGQCGDRTRENVESITAGFSELTFSKIISGRYHSGGITTDGNLYVWG